MLQSHHAAVTPPCSHTTLQSHYAAVTPCCSHTTPQSHHAASLPLCQATDTACDRQAVGPVNGPPHHDANQAWPLGRDAASSAGRVLIGWKIPTGDAGERTGRNAVSAACIATTGCDSTVVSAAGLNKACWLGDDRQLEHGQPRQTAKCRPAGEQQAGKGT